MSDNETPPTYRKRNASDIFAVDRRAWAIACGLGLNAAVAYLVLARGSGPDQRTVSWSVHAIENYTGISRPNGKKALERLKASGLVRQDKGGTKPKYYIMPAHDVPGAIEARPPLSTEEQRVLDLIRSGESWVPKVGRYDNAWRSGNPYLVARGLVKKGYLVNTSAQNFTLAPEPEKAIAEDWIWLPNAIIDGAGDEIPPVELIRQSQSVEALRLFIDLYHVHDLRMSGGIDWRPESGGIREKYTRKAFAERGQYIVWGFEPEGHIGLTGKWRSPISPARKMPTA